MSGNGRYRRRLMLWCGGLTGSRGFGQRDSPGHARVEGTSFEYDEPTPSGVGGLCTGGRSCSACWMARGPFGDVGVCFGRSEHHQSSAPALRIIAPFRWPMDVLHDFGRGGASGPSGLGRRPLGRRSPDWFAVLFGGDANLPRTAQVVHGQKNVHGGFGRWGRAYRLWFRPW